MRRAITASLIWSAALLSAPAPAAAQQSEAPPAGTPPAPGRPAGGLRTELEFFGGYQFESDLDRAGSVSAARTGAAANLMIPVGDQDRFFLDAAAQATFYSFDGATGLDPTGDPVGTVEYFALSGRYVHALDEHWGVYVGGGISSAGEPGADFGDTLQYGAGVGFSYAFSDSLSISPGIFVRTQLEESVLFVPMVNVDWKIDQQWRLATIFRAAGVAPGLSLSYSPSDQWRFALTGSYESRSYRLDDSGASPGGVFRDRRVPLDLSARWSITPALRLEATAGVALFGEFKVRNAAGDEVGAEDLDPAPFVGLTLTLRF